MRSHANRAVGPARPAAPGSQSRGRSGRDTPAAPAGLEVQTEAGIAALQATAGNRATVQALQSGFVVQRSLSVEQAESIATRLYDAMEGLGTDEEAIYGALVARTPTDYVAITEAYRHLYEEDLDAELADELTEEELARVKGQLGGTAETETLTEDEQGPARIERAKAIAQQLRDAMAGAGTEEDQIWNALEGRTPEEIAEIKRQYLALTGHHLDVDFRDDLSGEELRRALDLVGIRDVGTFENYVRQEMTEGIVTAGTGKFEWMLEPEQLRVEVPVNFVPDDGVTVPLAAWNTKVHDKWDQFAAIEPGGDRIPINIRMRSDADGDHRVNVHRNTDPDPAKYWKDRADAGNWYLVMKDSTVPHEFGHLVGLPDEYQRTGQDFAEIVGPTPQGPENNSGRTALEIAKELHGALYLDDEAQRAPSATALMDQVGLIVGGVPQQGAFAQSIKAAYDGEYGSIVTKTLVEAMRDKLPKGSKWTIQTLFSFASRSIMGDPEGLGGAATEHDHAVEPRHMRHFLDIIKRAYPDKHWTVGPK